MKKCSVCQVLKIKSDFHSHKKTSDRLESACKKCRNAQKKRWRTSTVEVRERVNKQRQNWRKKNAEKVKANQREIYARMTPEERMARIIKSNYNITIETYNVMLKSQDSKCAICRQDCVVKSRLSIDHNHQTGQVRGLLCSRCNVLIGMAREDISILKSAIDYLIK